MHALREEVQTQLIGLQRRLASREGRRDARFIAEVLADGFIEIGASGKVYDKRETMAALVEEAREEAEQAAPDTEIVLDELVLRVLSDDTVLLTCRAFDPALRRTSLRSCIWQARGGKWQLVFEQGVAVA